MQRTRSLVLIAALFLSSEVFAGSGPTLIVDINTEPRTDELELNISGAIDFGSLFMFAASMSGAGLEPWVSDGTPSGTRLLRDVSPEASSVNSGLDPKYVRSLNDRVLWARARPWPLLSDGTAEGTLPMTEVFTDLPTGWPEFMGPVNDGHLFFTITNDASQLELWRTDGTASGTHRVMTFGTGASVIGPAASVSAVYLDSILYFACHDGIHGRDLWRTDGTEAGTFMVKDFDIQDSLYVQGVCFLEQIGDRIFFHVINGSSFTPWVSDGTAAGTLPLAPSPEQTIGWTSNFTNADGRVFFFTSNHEQLTTLWTSDGTPDGTLAIRDFHIYAEWMVALADQLLFFTRGESLDDIGLWVSDGTLAGTTKLGFSSLELVPDSMLASNVTGITSQCVFVADDQVHGKELWITDATVAGTRMVSDLFPGTQGSSPNNLTLQDDKIFFSATTDGTYETFWQLDLSTGQLDPILADARAYANEGVICRIALCRKGLLVAANDVEDQAGLWLYNDKTASATLLLSTPKSYTKSGISITDRLYHSPDPNVAMLGDEMFLRLHLDPNTNPGRLNTLTLELKQGATNGGNNLFSYEGRVFYREGVNENRRIHVYDPVTGPAVVADIDELGGPWARNFVGMKSKVYFFGRHWISGVGYLPVSDGLWETDGTNAGTRLVSPFSHAEYFATNGQLLFFSARKDAPSQDAFGVELWVSDGTSDGTFMLRDIRPGFDGRESAIRSFLPIGPLMYFAAMNGDVTQLWVSDGTVAGTHPVTDAGSSGYSMPSREDGSSPLVESEGTIFFVAFDDAHGLELWASDGTAGGTRMVKDICPTGNSVSYNSILKPYAHGVFFFAYDGAHGWEPWVSDGTEAGTFLLRDIDPGIGSSGGEINPDSQPFYNMTQAIAVNQGVLFKAADAARGNELWWYTGREQEVLPIGDINKGPAPASPVFFGIANQKIFFSALTREYGNELWSLDVAELEHRPKVYTESGDEVLSASPPSGERIFGTSDAGSHTHFRSFTVANQTSTIFHFSLPVLGGTGAPQFDLDTSEFVTILLPGESTSFAIRFAPDSPDPAKAFVLIAPEDPSTVGEVHFEIKILGEVQEADTALLAALCSISRGTSSSVGVLVLAMFTLLLLRSVPKPMKRASVSPLERR